MEKEKKFQQINWYPGHMFKSFKEVQANIKTVDLAIVLVDARIPKSSMNPEILKVLKNKPTLILLNKMDLADIKTLNNWIKYYEEQGFKCTAVDARNKQSLNKIKTKVEEALTNKIQRTQNRGLIQRNFRAMILGIPNVGKSTLINTIANKKRAEVGNKPGVTKNLQWIKTTQGFDLLDVPGILWPKLGDKEVGLNLAATGAIKDDILPLDDVVRHILRFMQNNHLDRLKEKYSLEIEASTEYIDLLDIIGKKRGALIKGNEIDYDRVYNIILNDFRSKNLGEISLDIL